MGEEGRWGREGSGGGREVGRKLQFTWLQRQAGQFTLFTMGTCTLFTMGTCTLFTMGTLCSLMLTLFNVGRGMSVCALRSSSPPSIFYQQGDHYPLNRNGATSTTVHSRWEPVLSDPCGPRPLLSNRLASGTRPLLSNWPGR